MLPISGFVTGVAVSLLALSLTTNGGVETLLPEWSGDAPFPLGAMGLMTLGSLAAAVLVWRCKRRFRPLSTEAADQVESSREMQARFDGILAGADEGFWDWRMQTGERWHSPRICELLDDSHGTIRGAASWIESIHEDDRKTFEDAMRRRIESRAPSSVEYRMRCRDREYRWFRDRGCIVEWSDSGEPIRASGSLADITQEQRRRVELDMNRELLQRAETIARVGGWKWDIDNNRLFWSEQVFRIHELPMTYRPELDVAIAFYKPESRILLARALSAARKKGVPFDLELAFVSAKDRNMWVRVIGEPHFEDGRIVRIHGTFQDVSERKRFELALQESEQRYKLAVESAADGIWDWNIISDKMVHNESWFEMLGYDSDEIVASFDDWMGLIHPDDAAHVRAILQAYLDNKTPRIESRHRMRTKSGDWKWILTRGKIVARDPTGRPLRMLGTHKDVSFDKEVEEQLRAAYRAAEAATRAKTEFLANMSHEIRTPMTAILGFSENLLDADIDESERIRAVQTIRRNGEHLLNVINDILDLSKIEAGRLSVERIPCSVVDIACETMELLRLRADTKQLKLALEFDGSVPRLIESDPTRLRQILLNIVGNAIKFTENGGVRIVLRFLPDAVNPMLQFDVIDTGIGLDAAKIPALFRPFSQADTTMARRFGGTGLGLVISRRLAELLGGSIRVDSEGGKGSTFSISVATGDVAGVPFIDRPSTSTNVAVGHAADAAPEARLGARVLVAEDGPDNQRLITMMLLRAGAMPVIVENGKEAIKQIEANSGSPDAFDVVLMDMQMPVLDGYEATRRLRMSGYARPIIALTAHSMRGDREKCIEAGCTDYLTKPIRRNELIACIRGHLAGSTAVSADL